MRPIILLYIAGIAYSIVRYVVFAPHNAENIPVFIVNKGVAMVAAICFAVGFLQQIRLKRGQAVIVEPSTWFRAGVFGAIIHVPIALAILQPAYFPEFYNEGRMSFAGELVFIFGGLTAAMIYLLLRPQWSPMIRWRLSLTAMFTLLAHVLAMGYCRGLNIDRSHAYLPPMWLLSAIAIAIAIWFLLRSKPIAEGDDRDHLMPPAQ